MNDQIERGLNERDECYKRIQQLEHQNKTLIEFLHDFKDSVNIYQTKMFFDVKTKWDGRELETKIDELLKTNKK